MCLVKVRNLTKEFVADTKVLDSLSLDIKKGEVFGLVGANGAGKTTLIRILMTLLYPSSGHASINNHDTVKSALQVREIVGYLPQETGFYNDLSVEQNLKFVANLRGISLESLPDHLSSFFDEFGIYSFFAKKTSELSGGQRRRVAIARSLIGDPMLLCLDEPTVGLDILAAQTIYDMIKKLATKTTIILSTHNIRETEELCTSIALMNEGRILLIDSPDNLRRNVPSLYTGSSDGGDKDLRSVLVDALKHFSDNSTIE